MPHSTHKLPSEVTEPHTKAKVDKAVALIKRTLDLYPQQVAFSFNGGKDSTVLLHLIRLALQQAQGDSSNGSGNAVQGVGGVRTFYFCKKNEFEEVIEFIHETEAKFKLQTEWIDSEDYIGGLQSYLERTGVRAVILGTRKGDPNAGDQEFFCPSSEGWPPFMRVNPILDWNYHDVWTFLRQSGVDYCPLYNQGYTSLGSRSNTIPNSALRQDDGSYAPAYMLADGRLERAGRIKAVERTPSTNASRLDLPPALTWRAGLVIVGDEILSGKVTDANAPFLMQELRKMGWAVCKVVMIPDDVQAIANEVHVMSAAYEVVITSGGVGPTLDDVTMEGIAEALANPLVRNPEFEERLRSHFGSGTTAAHLKMAETPQAEVELLDVDLPDGSKSAFPVVKCRNIFVLPGIPHLLRQKWAAVRKVLEAEQQLKPFRNRVLRLSLWDETRIAPALQQLHAHVCTDVAIGSYPVEQQPDGAQILVTLESKHPEKLEEASQQLAQLLPPGIILGEDVDVQTLLPKERFRRSFDLPGSARNSPLGHLSPLGTRPASPLPQTQHTLPLPQ